MISKRIVKQMEGKLIYLAGAYTHDNWSLMDHRFKILTRVSGLLVEHGIINFSPITHSHQQGVFNPRLGTCWPKWAENDTLFLSRCDELWVLTEPGWEASVGVTAEIELAKTRFGIPVRYIRYIHETQGIELEDIHETKP